MEWEAQPYTESRSAGGVILKKYAKKHVCGEGAGGGIRPYETVERLPRS